MAAATGRPTAAPAAGPTLDGLITPLDLLRLQSIEMPPRGLVICVGCIGVLLGLAEQLPEWAGCKNILKGQRLLAPPTSRRLGSTSSGRSRLAAAGAAVQQGVSFWSLIEKFSVDSVTPAQKEAVLDALRKDVGGLALPHHLEQISRAAAVLGRWLQSVQALLKAPPPLAPSAAAPSTADPPLQTSVTSTLFAAPERMQCARCGARLEPHAFAEHDQHCAMRQLQQAQLEEQRGRDGIGVGERSRRSSGSPRELQDSHGMSPREMARMEALAAERVHRLRASALPPPPPAPRSQAPSPSPAASAPSPAAPPPSPPTEEEDDDDDEPPPQAPPPPLSASPPAAAAPPAVTEAPAPLEPSVGKAGWAYLRARIGGAGLRHMQPEQIAHFLAPQPSVNMRRRSSADVDAAASQLPVKAEPNDGVKAR